MEKHTFHKGKVKPMKIWPGMTTNELVNEMGKSGSFMAGTLSKAVDTYEEMVKTDSYIFLTLSGALVPAGMNKVIILIFSENKQTMDRTRRKLRGTR